MTVARLRSSWIPRTLSKAALALLAAAVIVLAAAPAAVAFGTFAPKVDYPVGDFPRSVAVGDFNDDGRRDLAVANPDDDDVSILRGKSAEQLVGEPYAAIAGVESSPG